MRARCVLRDVIALVHQRLLKVLDCLIVLHMLLAF